MSPIRRITFAYICIPRMERYDVYMARSMDTLKKATFTFNFRPEYEYVHTAVISNSDWFPKRRSQRIWVIKFYEDRGRNNIRLTKTWRGPRQPGELFTFDEGLELWFSHVRFALT